MNPTADARSTTQADPHGSPIFRNRRIHQYKAPVLRDVQPYRDERVVIRSRPGIYLLQSTSESVGQWSAALSRTLRVLTRHDLTSLGPVNETLTEKLDAISRFIDEETERLKGMVTSFPDSGTDGYTNSPEQHVVRVYTPMQRMYLHLLVKADHAFKLVDDVWFGGVMQEDECERTCLKISRQFIRFNRFLMEIAGRAKHTLERQAEEQAKGVLTPSSTHSMASLPETMPLPAPESTDVRTEHTVTLTHDVAEGTAQDVEEAEVANA